MARHRDEHEFLPAALEVLETPPHPAARFAAIVIALFFVTGLVWSILGHIDTVAVAQGQIVPSDRVKLVQPIENGVIRAIHVKDGQRVRAGEVLIELDPSESSANVETLRSDLLKAQLDAAIAAALLADDPSVDIEVPGQASGHLVEAARLQLKGERQRLAASLAAIDAEVAELEAAIISHETDLERAKATLPLAEDRLEGLETLNEKDLVRKPDLFAARQQVIDTESLMATASSGIKQADARLLARRNKRAEIIAAARADALEKRSEALRKVSGLEQQLKKEEQRATDRNLRAPVDGLVVGLSVFTVGGVATTKDVLMRIVPESSPLEAEVSVLNKDIGFVAKGQPAEIKLETFPFTRYGLIKGVVKEVWRDAAPDEKQGLVYKAEIALKQDRILVGSEWVALAPGMAVQAEIRTGERRAIDYFLSPVLRYRDESLRER